MNVYSVSPGSRARAGRMHRGRGLAGYTRVWNQDRKFAIGWRWKHETEWHMGSVRTREEMLALRKLIHEALERGEEPGPLPTYDLRDEREPTAAERTPEEIETARAAMRALMARDERCAACGLLRPCAPCPGDPETKHEMRTARRNAG